MGDHMNFPREEQGLGDMASAEREPATGVWGRIPSGVQGQSPWSRGQGQSPLKLKDLKHLHT